MTDAAPSVEERLRRLEAENTELRKENAQKKAAAGAPKSPATEAKQRRRTPKSRRKRVTSTDFFMPVGPGAEMEDGFQRTVADLLGDQGKAFKQALVETNIQHINDYGNALSIINSDHGDEIFFAIFDKACAMGKVVPVDPDDDSSDSDDEGEEGDEGDSGAVCASTPRSCATSSRTACGSPLMSGARHNSRSVKQCIPSPLKARSALLRPMCSSRRPRS